MGAWWSCPTQGTAVIVESCGKFQRVAYPGFNCLYPCLCECPAGTVSLRVQQLDVRCESKTKDNVFVHLVVAVQYQVSQEHIYDAFYRLTDSHAQISSYVFDVVRASVPKLNLDEVFSEKDHIAKGVKDELTKAMSTFGFIIIGALVVDIDPAQKVKEAMNEINAAQRMRVAAAEKAEASKVAVVKAAEADAEAKYLHGQGIARQRIAIMNGLQNSVQDFSQALPINPKEVMEIMVLTQYFDTLRDVGASNKSSTVFLPHTPGGLTEVTGQIRNVFLQASAQQEMNR